MGRSQIESVKKFCSEKPNGCQPVESQVYFPDKASTKECRISVRGETLYLTMLSAVTPTQ